jgi:hypothetical protein
MIVRNLQATRELLKAGHYDLQDIMAVGGSEKSTLDKYEFEPNTIIGKTGSVNPVIGFSGLTSTAEGDLLFAYIMGTDGEDDWVDARKEIKDALLVAEEEHGGAKVIDYTAPAVSLTFDELSAFSSVLPELF